jgi:outer membrane protein TolC
LSYKREIIPLAQSAFKITEKNYETGRANFSKLSDSVRALLDAELKYPEEVNLYGEHLAKLERAVGGSVPFSTKKGESNP